MNWKELLIWIGMLSLPCTGVSQVEVSGDVAGEWTQANSPYIVVGDLHVPAGSELLVRSGVQVLFDGAYRLLVNGHITSRGDINNRVTFDWRNEGQTWRGIRIMNSDQDNSFSYSVIAHSEQVVGYPDEDSRGGGFYAYQSRVSIVDCEFHDNRSTGEGGAVTLYLSNGEFLHNNLHDNHGYTEIVWLQSCDVPVMGCQFINNIGEYCAGLELESCNSAVTDNVFRFNQSLDMNWGNGIYLVHGSRPEVRNNLIADNIGAGGMFIGYDADPAVFSQNTIVNNTGRTGIFMVNAGRLTATDCIIRGNEGTDIELFNGAASIAYSDIHSAPGTNFGPGMIDQDPRFIDAQNGNYSLSINSPCRDSGDPNSPRDPDGTRADMGRYYGLPIAMDFIPDSIAFQPTIRGRSRSQAVQMVYLGGELDRVLLQFRPSQNSDWISVNIDEDQLAAGDTSDLVVTATVPDNARFGTLWGGVDIFIEEGELLSYTIPVRIDVIEAGGTLEGNIRDQRSDDPVVGATITIRGPVWGPYSTVSDADGRYTFQDAPIGHYAFRTTHPDYLPYQDDSINILADQVANCDAHLLFATCEVHPQDVNVAIDPGQDADEQIGLVNSGSGDLQFNTSIHIPGIPGINPFDSRLQIAAENVLRDDRLAGVEFAQDHIFVAGGNRGRGRGKIYVLSREGDSLWSFDQFVNSAYGMRDLAWDGDFLWGGDNQTLYSFTPEGRLNSQFNTPMIGVRGVAFDPSEELLWVCSFVSPLCALDREGNQIHSIQNPGVRIFGLAWYPDDPDGACLYLFTSIDADHPCALQKMNTTTGVMSIVADLPVQNTNPVGLAMTEDWDPRSWVMLGVLKSTDDSPDRVGVFQIGPRSDWLSLTPRSGVVPAGDNLDVTLTLSSDRLPADQVMEATARFEHNGRGQAVELPIRMTVSAGNQGEVRQLDLSSGWNLVSLNVAPPNNDVRAIFRPLAEQNVLNIVKDQAGRFYTTAHGGFNNIPGWAQGQAYAVRVTQACSLAVRGATIPADEPIPLRAGWGAAAYYPRRPVDATVALAGLGDYLIIAKDGPGNFYAPRLGFCNMEPCREGQGYRIKMSNARDLVWRLAGRDGVVSITQPAPVHFPQPAPTDCNMSILVLDPEIQAGEVGVFANGELVGAGSFLAGRCGVAVQGRGIAPESKGAETGDPLELRIWSEGTESRVPNPILMEGSLAFEADGFAAVRLAKVSEPTEFRLAPPVPNPFNSRTTLSFDLPQSGKVGLHVFDAQGRCVQSLLEGVLGAGSHRVDWNAQNLPAGVYLIRLEAGGNIATQKAVLMK